MGYHVKNTAEQVDATEIICVRQGEQPRVLLSRPGDVDIILSFMQDAGFICGTKAIKTDAATLAEFAIDVTQL